jgi:hypothetical protein
MSWRENHKEEYLEYQRTYQRQLYNKNKDLNNRNRTKRYNWAKISLIFRNILLD